MRICVGDCGVGELAQTLSPGSRNYAVSDRRQRANPTKNAIETMGTGLKLTSTDHLGALGRGEGVASLAVVLLEEADGVGAGATRAPSRN